MYLPTTAILTSLAGERRRFDNPLFPAFNAAVRQLDIELL